LRKALVPTDDQPDFPVRFPVRLPADLAERHCVGEGAVFVVDYIVRQNPGHDRGILQLNMLGQSGTPYLVTKICSPETWPWQREHAFRFPGEAAAALLQEWDPTGPKVQQN
jgi:hypothetical protein